MRPAVAVLIVTSIIGLLVAAERGGKPTIQPLLRAVDLKVGQQREVALANGKTATVKLLKKARAK